MRHSLPKLFKRNNNGKLMEWQVFYDTPAGASAYYTVRHGQVGGKIQETTTLIKEGKNIGKANETTLLEQAANESRSKWNKQLDKGYAETPETANLLIKPMLAQEFGKSEHKMVYPCYVQPKLDGIRCLAYFEQGEGKVVLLSRQAKRWKVLKHIEDAVANQYFIKIKRIVLDGELYCHTEDFEELASAIKRDTPTERTKDVEYHIYDCFDLAEPSWTFQERSLWLANNLLTGKEIKRVNTHVIFSKNDIISLHEDYTGLGYEGVMVRHPDSFYECDKRSHGLLKYKIFLEEEFEIVGAVENKGKQAGQCCFICKTKEGSTFKVKPEGSDATRRKYWRDHKKLIGKMLTVKFFAWTKTVNRVPRFPVGKAIRDYEN